MPGPVVGDLDHAPRRPPRAGAARSVEPGRRVAGGVVEQVEDHPVQLVGVALDRQRAARSRSRSSRSPISGATSTAALPAISARSQRRCGADPAGVGAGEQQQVGDQPAHPLRGAQRRVDHRPVVVLAGLVAARPAAARGWRGCWSAACAARARRRRRTRAASSSPPRARPGRRRASAASAPGCGPARRPRRRPSAPACGGRGRRCRRSCGRVAVSAEIGRIARAAIARPARLASRVPPRTPAAMKSQRRSTVESTCAMLRPYWT